MKKETTSQKVSAFNRLLATSAISGLVGGVIGIIAASPKLMIYCTLLAIISMFIAVVAGSIQKTVPARVSEKH